MSTVVVVLASVGGSVHLHILLNVVQQRVVVIPLLLLIVLLTPIIVLVLLLAAHVHIFQVGIAVLVVVSVNQLY
jgi:hypothetical protein